MSALFQTVLHAIKLLPSVGKYLLALVLLANIHSFPFSWHTRFWWPAVPRMITMVTQGRQAYLDKCQRRIVATGGVAARVKSKRRAWFDDCDHNMHLSNSCYAKSADHSTSKWMWINMPILFEAGAFPALGGTHYTFIREIPILSEYHMESRVVGWGDKWYYFVTEFIIYPTSRKPRSKTTSAADSGIATPASGLQSGTSTPPQLAFPSTDTTSPRPEGSGAITPPGGSGGPDLAGMALAALRTPKARSDGGIVACIAVHEVCLKVGRITIPPRIAFHLCGLSLDPGARVHARALSTHKKVASAWLAGGWKAEANAAEIGQEIIPCMSDGGITAEKEDARGAVSKGLAQSARVVKGMQGVSMGLAEAVQV